MTRATRTAMPARLPGQPFRRATLYGPEDLPVRGLCERRWAVLLTLGFGAFPLYTGLPAPGCPTTSTR